MFADIYPETGEKKIYIYQESKKDICIYTRKVMEIYVSLYPPENWRIYMYI